ncbi:unnamed protein product, partial [Hapterophycus canaliculatus]
RQNRPGNLVYLDHAGATLFGVSQLREAMEPLLAGTIHGNPHSQGPVSTATGARIDAARNAVLQHFSASPRDWSVVFTSGATAALKMVGEQFPWRRRRRRRGRGETAGGSRLVHARRSHNSVLGIREYARAEGADVECLDLEFGLDDGKAIDGRRSAYEDSDNNDYNSDSDSDGDGGDDGVGAEGESVVDSLFAFPAECNATGLRPNLDIAARVKRGALSAQRHRCRRRALHHCRGSASCESASLAGTAGSAQGQCRRERHLSATAVTGRTNGADAEEVKEEKAGQIGPSAAVDGRQRRRRRRRERWWVLLDAAKFAGTAPLDLSKVEADFVAVSFYKIFGWV